MDGDAGAVDAFEDALVGGGLAAGVVLGLETVNGDDDVELFVLLPFRRDGAEGAGDDLGVDAAGFDLGDELLELAIADHGVAADEGDVQGLVLIEESENAGDELVAFVVGKLAQLSAAAEVGGVEGVAAGTAQGALFGDFDGDGRGAAGEDPAPGVDDFGFLHANSATAVGGLFVKGWG